MVPESCPIIRASLGQGLNAGEVAGMAARGEVEDQAWADSQAAKSSGPLKSSRARSWAHSVGLPFAYARPSQPAPWYSTHRSPQRRLACSSAAVSCLVQKWTRVIRVIATHFVHGRFPRMIAAAHAGETIVVAKGGKPWAWLLPLEPPTARRVPGVLAGRLKLPPPEQLLEPLSEEELAAIEQPLL